MHTTRREPGLVRATAFVHASNGCEPMSFILAFGFLALAVLGIVTYNGTPHDGPTSVCSPINFFGSVLTVPFDCRYFSLGEIVFTILCFVLAVVAAFSARPSRPGPGVGPKV